MAVVNEICYGGSFGVTFNEISVLWELLYWEVSRLFILCFF